MKLCNSVSPYAPMDETGEYFPSSNLVKEGYHGITMLLIFGRVNKTLYRRIYVFYIFIRIIFSFMLDFIKKISNEISRIFYRPKCSRYFSTLLILNSKFRIITVPQHSLPGQLIISITHVIATSTYPKLPQVCLKQPGTSQTKSSNSSHNFLLLTIQLGSHISGPQGPSFSFPHNFSNKVFSKINHCIRFSVVGIFHRANKSCPTIKMNPNPPIILAKL